MLDCIVMDNKTLENKNTSKNIQFSISSTSKITIRQIFCGLDIVLRSLLTLYLFLIHVLGKVNSAKIKQQF